MPISTAQWRNTVTYALVHVIMQLSSHIMRWFEQQKNLSKTTNHGAKSGFIVHSKKNDPWGVFDFFQMFSKIFQFSLFQCLKVAFVLLTFQFQVCSTLGKQLSLFRAKISGFAFSPTSKRSLQVRAVHVPILPAARKGQSPMTLHSNCTGAMQRGRQQKIRDVLV